LDKTRASIAMRRIMGLWCCNRQKNSRKPIWLLGRGFVAVAAQGGCLFVLCSVRALRVCAWLPAGSRKWRRPPKPPSRCAQPTRCAWLLRRVGKMRHRSRGRPPSPLFPAELCLAAAIGALGQTKGGVCEGQAAAHTGRDSVSAVMA
jgi:hypothetical protein